MGSYLYIHYHGLDGATLSYLGKTSVDGTIEMVVIDGRRDTWIYAINEDWLKKWAVEHNTTIADLADEEESYELQEELMKDMDTFLSNIPFNEN